MILRRFVSDLHYYIKKQNQVAHGILFETIRQLEDQGIHVPQSLRRSFVLLHSYILVRHIHAPWHRYVIVTVPRAAV